MKKIIYILFLFLLPITCYLIYKFTLNNNPNITIIGNNIIDSRYIKNNILVKSYNNLFTNKDYRIIDLINILKYNQELEVDNKQVSIHQILKKTDILIISIGMNDIYYKLNDDSKEIYTYINNMINNYELLLDYIRKYDYQKVIILGYYNTKNKHNDLFTYINYKLKNIVNNNNYIYLDLQNELYNHKEYYKNNLNYYLNNTGTTKISELIVEKIKKY